VASQWFLSATAFKGQADVSDSIYKWLAIYRHEKGIGPRSAKRSPAVTVPAVTPTVFIKANLPQSPTPPHGPCLEYPSGWRVQFASNIPPDLLVSALRGLTCN
jgi:hypothetical protein